MEQRWGGVDSPQLSIEVRRVPNQRRGSLSGARSREALHYSIWEADRGRSGGIRKTERNVSARLPATVRTYECLAGVGRQVCDAGGRDRGIGPPLESDFHASVSPDAKRRLLGEYHW